MVSVPSHSELRYWVAVVQLPRLYPGELFVLGRALWIFWSFCHTAGKRAAHINAENALSLSVSLRKGLERFDETGSELRLS